MLALAVFLVYVVMAAQFESLIHPFVILVSVPLGVIGVVAALVLTGTGDVLEPDDGVVAIGSGGNYALAAARAMTDREDLDAEGVARRAMAIAAEICVYTNTNLTVESL